MWLNNKVMKKEWIIFLLAASLKAQNPEHTLPTNTSGVKNKPTHLVSCPEEILDQVLKKDDQGSWLYLIGGHKPQDCAEAIADSFSSAAEMEKTFQTLTDSFSKQSMISCIDAYSTEPIPEGLKKMALAEHYVTQSRLKTGFYQTQNLIKEINDLKSASADGETCGGKTPLANLALETIEATKLLYSLNEDIKKTSSQESINAKESILNLYPWLREKPFQKFLGVVLAEEGPLTKELDNHFTQMRTAAESQNKQYQEAMMCVSGPRSNCWEKHIDTIMKSPQLDFQESLSQELAHSQQSGVSDAEKVAISRERIPALNRLSAVSCVHEKRLNKIEMSKEAGGAALNIALTLATFGAGSAISGASALAKGSQAVAQASTRTGKAWQSLTRTRTIKAHSLFAKHELALQGARAFILGVDTTSFKLGVEEAVDACTSSGLDLEVKNLEKETQSKGCLDLALRSKVLSQQRSCLAASIAAATGVLPFVPPVLGNLLKRKSPKSLVDHVAKEPLRASTEIVEESFNINLIKPFTGQNDFTRDAYIMGTKLKSLSGEQRKNAANYLAAKISEAEKSAEAILLQGRLDEAAVKASEQQYYLEIWQTLFDEDAMTKNKDLLEMGL